MRESINSRIPAIAACIAGFAGLYVAVAVHAQTPEPGGSENTLRLWKENIGFVMALIGFVSLIAGVIWGLVNRKNYDKLKETISDLEASIESKDTRIEELKLSRSDEQAKFQLQLHTCNTNIENLKVSNEAIVGQNLQMKAILKKLRLGGKWEGHEESLHVTDI